MTQFEIVLEDKPGELARLTATIAHINIRSMVNERACNGRNVVRFMTVDEEGTRQALSNNSFEFSENDILLINLRDRPGELAKLTRKLADEQINVGACHLIDRGLFGIRVNSADLKHAIAILGDCVVKA